jgi:hypothetical protein
MKLSNPKITHFDELAMSSVFLFVIVLILSKLIVILAKHLYSMQIGQLNN